jgi:tripartite-type tricarboxylate transporter receptor subunit TctC
MVPILRACLVAVVACAAAHAHASEWPARTVRIVAAQQAGSATDSIARALADALEDAWGQPVIVENRVGASGAIGTVAAARAAPDGYTLLVGGLSNLVTSPLLEPGYGFDPEQSFVPIGRVAFVPFVVGIHPDVPAATLQDLVAHARRHPGSVVFATSGPTAFSRLCIELLAREQHLDLLTVEYKSAPAATLDLVAGRAQLHVSEIASMKSYADAGKIRLLAIAGNRRSALLPAVPTFAEAGGVDIPMTPWYGVLAPAGVPPGVLARLEAGYREAMRDPRLLQRIEALGYEPIVDAPGAFAAALKRDIAAVRTIARRLGRVAN